MKQPSRDPATNMPLNPPDGALSAFQRAYLDEIDDRQHLSPTRHDEADMAEDEDELEDLDSLTEQELRADETDDPIEAIEEGYTYVPPIDPPIEPGDTLDGAEIASGMSALDEPYDQDQHITFLSDDDEVSARVREALRADSSTTQYAGRIGITTRHGTVILRGVVDDLVDSDNLLAVAEEVDGVEEVVDHLRVRGLE